MAKNQESDGKFPETDPRVDAYVAKSEPFARPLLEHLRRFMVKRIPDASETIKWGVPHYTVNGKNLVGFAAFKKHVSIAVHGAADASKTEDTDGKSQSNWHGQFRRITSMEDMPSDQALFGPIEAARQRILKYGTALGAATKAKGKPSPKPLPAMGDDFAEALVRNPAATAAYDQFSASHKREYLEWIDSAKRPETRAKRIAEATAWLAEGKPRNWKYEK